MPDTADLETGIASLRPRLHRLFAARQAGHLAEDLASETILRVLTALRRGDQIQNLAAYAAGTARRVLLEYYRSRDEKAASLTPSAEAAAPASEPDPSEEDSSEERDLWIARLRACLRRLPPEDRAFLSEYYAEGSNKANRARLAATLGISPNALQIRACRARRSLRLCAAEEAAAAPVRNGAPRERFSGQGAPEPGDAP